MGVINIKKSVEVTSPVGFKYTIDFTAKGETNFEEIKKQKESVKNLDLDDPKFSFCCVDNPKITNITYSIKDVDSFVIPLDSFKQLDNESKEAGIKKIKRFLGKWESWKNEEVG